MIKSVRKRIFSALAITYALASANVMAEEKEVKKQDSEEESHLVQEVENISLNTSVNESTHSEEIRVEPFEDHDMLKIGFEDGEQLYWRMEIGFSVFETQAPFGMNESGLVIETEINEFANTYSTDVDDRKTKLKSNDFPSWILSKYKSVDQIKKDMGKVAIVKESNDNALTYFIQDKYDSISIEVKDGNVIVI